MPASVEVPCPPPARVVSTRLGPIQYASTGSGMPVLAIHGGMGGYDQSWVLAQALFHDDKLVIAVSRPGYLGTPLRVGSSPIQQADAYAALLDALGIEKTIVAAISAGGPSAIQFAIRYPTRCAGLILVSAATGRMQAPPRIASRLRTMALLANIPGIPFWLRRRAAKNPLAAAMRSIRDPATAAAMLAHPIAGRLFRAFQQSFFLELAARIPGTRNDIAQLSDLPEIPFDQLQVPTLVIHGTEDRIVPVVHGNAVRAANVTWAPVTGGEHVTLFTHLQQVQAAVSGFAPLSGGEFQ